MTNSEVTLPSDEERIVEHLLSRGFNENEVIAACEDPSLNLNPKALRDYLAARKSDNVIDFKPNYTDDFYEIVPKTPEGALQYLEHLFSRAGKEKPHSNMTVAQKAKYLTENGAQNFKRKALGICGSSTVKTKKELADLLVETNIARSLEEGLELVPKIVHMNSLHGHAINRGGLRYMAFERLAGEGEKYKITAWAAD